KVDTKGKAGDAAKVVEVDADAPPETPEVQATPSQDLEAFAVLFQKLGEVNTAMLSIARAPEREVAPVDGAPTGDPTGWTAFLPTLLLDLIAEARGETVAEDPAPAGEETTEEPTTFEEPSAFIQRRHAVDGVAR
ncbi:MAG TPA: hypothetical protein VEI97_11160, partial [bacterium]|nr:hypothetical protein [bacterium]